MKQQSATNNIDLYISNVIKESVRSVLQKRNLREQEEGEKGSPAADNEDEKMKKGDVTVEDIIDKLNSIRAGKSFKDDAVKASFEKYFNDLDSEEKVALLAFMKGISQILTGEVEASAATDPSDKPAKIEMEKKGGPSKRTLKPLVIKAPEVKKEKAKSSEDTSGPVPITPKKK
ncbi:MAG: hypothetical protein FJZ60_00245 [Chlamydiae bacterium]|nr:hypothetical protein [Chlamydiota bacterium]